MNPFGSILWGLEPTKSLIFIEMVVIFKVFSIFCLDVILGLFRWPLGGRLGTFWRPSGASWGLLGPSWGVLGAFFGNSWGHLGRQSAQDALKMAQRGPKTPQNDPQGPPKRPPGCFQEAFSSPKMASKNVSKWFPKNPKKTTFEPYNSYCLPLFLYFTSLMSTWFTDLRFESSSSKFYPVLSSSLLSCLKFLHVCLGSVFFNVFWYLLTFVLIFSYYLRQMNIRSWKIYCTIF